LVQAGTTKYEYDAEDNRTAVIKNAGTTGEVRTEYVVDSVEELSRVLMAVERKSENTVVESGMEGTTGNEALQTTCFYYGNGLSAQENEKDGYLTYHFNNVGSTNAVTDEKGVVKYSYTYNSYGELTQGSYGQVMFLFNGQYGVASDDNGLYYMRARYYNVSIKRFINQDVVTGNIAESQSLNRYAYVEGNPVSYLDPFGLERVETTDIFGMAKTIAKMYIQDKYEEIVGPGTTSYGYNESIAAGALIGGNHQITYDGKGNIAFQMVVNVGAGFPGVSISGYKSKSNAQDVMGTEGHGAVMGGSFSAGLSIGKEIGFGNKTISDTTSIGAGVSECAVEFHGTYTYTYTVVRYNIWTGEFYFGNTK
ncbi:MAG: RHS repeat-associated core domain-containing protein, partial [Roseburia sp.]|nr:RHS repeat-associated core domain-containing protein [Roseburia sp.]MCM1280026.1 RHS repeat-associated core domain-containing protein [Robinsoniella sp.]